MHHIQGQYIPRVMAVEVTQRCNLNCIHCRAAASGSAPKGELTLDDYENFFKELNAFPNNIVILTGGEPLLRKDIFEIIETATRLGFRTALSTNGTLITKEKAIRLHDSGVNVASISIDGSLSEIHDDFRKQRGAFDASITGIRFFQDSGVRIQVNTSLTKRNMDDLDNIHNLVKSLHVDAWHIFLLVPTGRGRSAADKDLINAVEYERILNRIYEMNRDDSMEIKPTCAPQYYRILRQRAKIEGIPLDRDHFGINAVTRGCLAGTGFAFLSYRGDVFPCGYYPIKAGSINQQPFEKIWKESPLFMKLRDFSKYEGFCGRCDFFGSCGGCRARAYALTGNDLAQEPFCSYAQERMKNKDIENNTDPRSKS